MEEIITIHDDIVSIILDLLSSVQDRFSFVLTCKSFASQLSNNQFWHNILLQYDPDSTLKPNSKERLYHLKYALNNLENNQLSLKMKITLPNGFGEFFMLSDDLLIAHECSGWWSHRSHICHDLVIINLNNGSQNTMTIPVPEDCQNEGWRIIFISTNHKLYLCSATKACEYNVIVENEGIQLEYLSKLIYDEQESNYDICDIMEQQFTILRNKNNNMYQVPFSKEDFPERMSQFKVFGQNIAIEWKMHDKENRYNAIYLFGDTFNIKMKGPHINHSTPYAIDSKYMIVAKSAGEDAAYSLQLVNLRTGIEVKTIDIPTPERYIEVGWRVSFLWESSTFVWIAIGGNYAPGDNRPKTTLYVIKIE